MDDSESKGQRFIHWSISYFLEHVYSISYFLEHVYSKKVYKEIKELKENVVEHMYYW